MGESPFRRPVLAMRPIAKVNRCTSLVLLSLVAATAASSAATYFVKTTGDDAAPGTSREHPFKTLVRASQILKHGDSLVIAPGTYRESLLIAERFGTEKLPMEILGDETGARTASAPGAIVLLPADASLPALRLHRVQHVKLEGLTFGPGAAGLALQQCREVLVTRCTFDRMASGFSAARCTDLRLEASEFKRCGLGVTLNGVVRARISHVTAVGSASAALSLVQCGAGTLKNSLLTAKTSNLIADELSAASWTSDHNVLTGTTGPWGQVPAIAVPNEWFAASGQDRHSVYVAPAFRDANTLDLAIDSAVRWPGGLPGQNVGETLTPAVPLDRAGKAFRQRHGQVSCGAFDYPDPTPRAGWTPIAPGLEGVGPRQSAGLYQTDGTLVRQLVQDATGIQSLWWDGRDDDGRPVAPGSFQIRWATHDLRVVEDGSVGDNGSALGSYNSDNPEHLALLPDGRFMAASTYDETGIPLRLHSPSGVSVLGVNLADKNFQALTWSEGQFVGVVDPLPNCRLVILDENGERHPIAGAESVSFLSAEEAGQIAEEQKSLNGFRQALRKYESDLKRLQQQKKPITGLKKPEAPVNRGLRVGGIAASPGLAYVALAGLGLIRRIDLKSGAVIGTWPLPGVEGLAFDERGTLWAVAGRDIVALDTRNGAKTRSIPTSLPQPRYLAAGGGRLAVGDRQADRIECLDAATGRSLVVLGSQVARDAWTPVVPDLFTDPRGLALYPDGRLLVADHLGIHCLWPKRQQAAFEAYSTFLDIGIAHPLRSEFVYSRMGIMRVDEGTGAWKLTHRYPANYGELIASQAFVIEGRSFIASGKEGAIQVIWEVSDPTQPRLAGELTRERFPAMYQKGIRPLCLTPELGLAGASGCQLKIAPFKGWDAENRPSWDFAATESRGQKAWPDRPGFTLKRGLACDPKSGDFYALAVTDRLKQMVPMWGADGTGVGKVDARGNVRWFVPSSGNNYQSISSIHDGRDFWVMACKSFGGQIDLFNSDGLLLGTGNWGWLVNHQVGFVDIISGCQAYRRSDGKPGAYVEDDLIGRFTRLRVDGTETLVRGTNAVEWNRAPVADDTSLGDQSEPSIATTLPLPRIQPLDIDGNWPAFEKAGANPQILAQPTVTWGRYRPERLLETCRAGAFAAAFAHDATNLYAYLVATDDTPRFDADTPAKMWAFDGFELWLEQEQFGLSFTRDGQPHLFKYRFHGRDGKDLYTCNYELPRDTVWGTKLEKTHDHPLGRRLEQALGRPLGGPGYAMMARIPFREVRLVGGLRADKTRQGEANLPVTGQAGEILRLGVTFDGVEAWSREQDFKVSWPAGLMYSDPSRSHPFAFSD